MPVPTNPYNCIGNTLYRTLFRYDRTTFATPTPAKDSATAMESILSTITQLTDELNGKSFPTIALPDFCADVPYKEISCRVQDNVANCEDDRPPINISAPIIVSPNPPPPTGKITPSTVVKFTTNIPANFTLESQVGGVWQKVAGTSKIDDLNYRANFISCVPIPPEGIPYRATACDLCCNTNGEFEENCDTVEFTLFACTSADNAQPLKFGWARDVLLCPADGTTNLCAVTGQLPYVVGTGANISLPTPFYQGEQLLLALPKSVCKPITSENFTFTGGTATVSVISLDITNLQNDPSFNSFLAQLGSADNYQFIGIVFENLTAPQVTAKYESTNSCGEPVSIEASITRAICAQVPSLKYATDDCTTNDAENAPLLFNLNDAIQKLTFFTCPNFYGEFRIIKQSDNSEIYSSVGTRLELSQALLSSLPTVLQATDVLRIEFLPEGIENCTKTASVTLQGLNSGGRVLQFVQVCGFDPPSAIPVPPVVGWSPVSLQPVLPTTLPPCSAGVTNTYAYYFRVVSNTGQPLSFASANIARTGGVLPVIEEFANADGTVRGMRITKLGVSATAKYIVQFVADGVALTGYVEV